MLSCRREGGASRAARQQWYRLAGTIRRCLEQRPCARGEGGLLGQHGYGGTIRPALAGTVCCDILTLVARVCCQGGLATVTLSGRTLQVPFVAAAMSWWQGGAAEVAWLWQYHPASPGRRHPVWRPCAGSVGVLPGWPGNGGIGQPALAGAVLRGGWAPASREHCRGGPGTAVRQAGPGSRHPVRRPLTSGKGMLPGLPGYSSTVWPAPSGGAAWHQR